MKSMPLNTVEVQMTPDTFYNPNMRFGTTFLDAQYRDYAVKGEVIMDKVSGELMLKRKIDGRIVSFSQNKKYLNDLLLELRISLLNATNVAYPYESDTAFYMNANYDLCAINDETLIDIREQDISINTGAIRFGISTSSNAFFVRPSTRDTDKAVVEFVTNFYNRLFEHYDGTTVKWVQERNKFRDSDLWKDSNTIVHYIVDVTDMNNHRSSYGMYEYVRMNELTPVYIHEGYDVEDGTTKSLNVGIIRIEFYKLHFILDNLDEIEAEFGSGLRRKFETEFKKLVAIDGRILANTFTVMSFIDSTEDITLQGKEFITALIDMPYFKRYMARLSKLNNSSGFFLSTDKPDESIWTPNTIWGEPIRTLSPVNGEVIAESKYTSYKALEAYIANNGISYTSITGNPVYEEQMLISHVDPGNILDNMGISLASEDTE